MSFSTAYNQQKDPRMHFPVRRRVTAIGSSTAVASTVEWQAKSRGRGLTSNLLFPWVI